MNLTRRTWFALASGLIATAAAGPALAARASVINVTLWDKGAMSMNMLSQGPMMGMGMEKPGAAASAPMHGGPMGPMGITASTHSVKAGAVTFEVVNSSKDMVHEMVLSPIKDEKTPLPFLKAENKVNEDAAGHLGEVSELEAGQKGALTVNLKPGRYILYCNIPGHYVLGMWTLLTVNK